MTIAATRTLRSSLRAMPTLLRVGAAETLAYRAEFIIWILTTTLPLVMLGLWTSVANERDGPFGNYTSTRFVAYYLTALIVRNVTGSWVVWQVNHDIRRGQLSLRLLRPIHPIVAYAATHLASIPLRSLVAIPFTVILLLSTARTELTGDPVLVGVFLLSLFGAWAVTFLTLVLIGAFSFFIHKSMAVFDLHLGLFAVLSGYLVPLGLLPGWARELADFAPYRYMLGFPVETLLGTYSRTEAVAQLGVQWLFVLAVGTVTSLVWHAGVRRYEAFGS